MRTHQLGIRIPPELAEELALRGDERSSVMRRDLFRYYEALKRARATLRSRLSPGEIALIADVCNGTLFDTLAIPLLWAHIEAVRWNAWPDDEEENLDADGLQPLECKWQVDGRALVAKLKALPYLDAAALVDAVERFWVRVGRGEQPDPRQLLDEPAPHPDRGGVELIP